MTTDLARIAQQVLRKQETLEERCREELERLEGPERWELISEVAIEIGRADGLLCTYPQVDN